MRKKNILVFVALLPLMLAISCTKSCKKSEDSNEPSVYFVSPKDNQTFSSKIDLEFGVKGMTLRPALEDVNDKTSGHHHILVDHPDGFIKQGEVIPVDDRHIHYGKAQTKAIVELTPGVHTLTMQFADGAHLSYGKQMATTITVTVK